VNLGPQYDYDEMGKESYYEPAAVSPDMQKKIDDEISKMMETGYGEALALVKKYRKKMDLVVKELLKTETLDRDQFEKIVGSKKQ
jgi:ATP-dependent Zn protease